MRGPKPEWDCCDTKKTER